VIVFYLLISLMPMDQDPFWGTFLGAGTLVKYVGLVCTVYAMFHLLVRRAPPRYMGTIQAPLFLLFFLLSSTSYWLLGPHFSLRASAFISYLSMVFLFFVVLTVVDTLKRLRWLLLTAIGAMGFTSLIIFREWMRDPMWRPGSISGDANYFALNLCLVFPVALLVVLRSRVLWERLFALGCVIAMIVANTLGASRGGVFALGASVLFLVWNSPRRLRNFTVIAILVLPPALLFPSSPVRRLLHPQASDVTGEVARLTAWKAGLRMIQQHPLTGIGLAEFKVEMPQYAGQPHMQPSIAHNTYIEIASECGMLTLLVFVAMLFFTHRNLGKVRRKAAESGSPLVDLAAFGLQSGLIGYYVGAVFLSAEYQKLFWLWLFLAMALPSLCESPAGQQQEAAVYAPEPAWKGAVADGVRGRGVGKRLPAPATSGYAMAPEKVRQLARHPGAVRKA